MAINAKNQKNYYCKGDQTYHYKSELPESLRPFVDYVFSSGGIAGDDFKSFNTKLRNAVKKLLPQGFAIHKWIKGHYYSSAVIKTPGDRFIYISFSDVRYSPNEWFTSILYRTMAHEADWRGGPNHYTSLFSLKDDLYAMERREKIRAWSAAAAAGGCQA